MQHDVIVIGAGPAGLAAAAYTLQQRLPTLMIAPDLGGRARFRLRLPWVPERQTMFGEQLVEQLYDQIFTAPQMRRHLDMVEQIFVRNDRFHVLTREGDVFQASAVIVASGFTARSLGVPGERRLMGSGVTYSATSHAPLFMDRRVIVVGSDHRALQAVAQLSALARHVTLIVPDTTDVGSSPLGRRLLTDARVTVLPHHTLVEILGDSVVSGVMVMAPDGQSQPVQADGVFIEMGLTADTDFVGTLVDRAPNGQIKVDQRCATRAPGLFAAGDVTNTGHAEQILIALGEGAKAGLSACAYVLEQ
jgi:NADH-dependent peroxiredoxin subunit F